MAKATLTKTDGTIVTIEGTPEEVEKIMLRVDGTPSQGQARAIKANSPPKASNRPQSITDYVIELKEADFFKKPQGLSEIKAALAAEAHIVPITTLSGRMLYVVKARHLRRVKEGKRWKYVNR